MFAVALANGIPFPVEKVANALAAYGGTVSRFGEGLLAHEWAGAAAPADGRLVALYGWIDEVDGSPAKDSAETYARAIARWDGNADRHLTGNYCAITRLDDGTLRLARSPWNAAPLYFARLPGGGIIASPLLRVLFVAGVEKRLDYDAIVQALGYGMPSDDTACVYHGVGKVPLGSVVTLALGQQPQIDRWYDPMEVPSQAALDEPERVERAAELLVAAAHHASRATGEKALALSGGLDSPLVAKALFDAGSGETKLRTITFSPHPDSRTFEDHGTISDERDMVREFARLHPRIEPHWADPQQAGFDFRAREMFQAAQLFAPGLANVGMYHGVYAKACELGCDWLLTADLGNQSFSADGRWAYGEYARRGRWGELLALLNNRPGDPRSLSRKLLALGLLPNLPIALRRRARQVVHPNRHDMVALLTLLTPEARESLRDSAWDDLHFGTSRADAVRADYLAEDGMAADVTLAFEQIHGVRHRDVTAYRPLLEFCAGLPTEAFASGGIERRLAKRMARGMMPEEQRANRRHGQHGADTMWRIGQRRQELLDLCACMREHDWLARTIDLERLERLLIDWPEAPGLDIDRDWPRMLAIPRAVLAAEFIAFSEGRNRL